MNRPVAWPARIRRALLDRPAAQNLRHRLAVRFEPRQDFKFTRFLRLPHQVDVLADTVIDLLAPAGNDRDLELACIGCSIGAQPYAIASVLRSRRPGLRFTMRGYDYDAAVLARARRGRYTAAEVLAPPAPPGWFVEQTFVRDGGELVVRPEVRAHTSFELADVLSPELAARVGQADVVLCQNLLVNLRVSEAKRAFAHLLEVLRPSAALLLDGVPLDLRERLTRAAGLVPVPHSLLAIHAEVRRLHGGTWPWHYWGVEPFDAGRAHALHRYATVFVRGEAAERLLEMEPAPRLARTRRGIG